MVSQERPSAPNLWEWRGAPDFAISVGKTELANLMNWSRRHYPYRHPTGHNADRHRRR